MFQGTIGKTADLAMASNSQAIHNLKLGDMMKQNMDDPQSELLLSFLPQVPSLKCRKTQLIIPGITDLQG